MTATLWPDVIGRLVRREDLPTDLVEQAMSVILSGDATDAQIAGFAVALRAKGETPDELATLVRTMLQFAEHVDLSDVDGPIVDTCGTGGDRAGTVNVSTMAALVAAAAGAQASRSTEAGRRRRSAARPTCSRHSVSSSTSGPTVSRAACAKSGSGSASRSGSMRRCASRRRCDASSARRPRSTSSARSRTLPVRPGGRSASRTPRWPTGSINTLAALGAERALVFYGHDGLDELTVTTTSTVHELRDGEIRVYDVDPTDFGIPVAEMGGLAGGDAAGNAEAVHKTLAGASGTDPRHRGPQRGRGARGRGPRARPRRPASAARRELLDDGSAAATLEALVRVSVAAREAGDG